MPTSSTQVLKRRALKDKVTLIIKRTLSTTLANMTHAGRANPKTSLNGQMVAA